MFAAIAGGILADSIGRRKTVVLSMMPGSVAMLALSQANGLLGMVVVTVLATFAAEPYRPAAAALVADLVTPGNRVLAFADYRVPLNASWMIGPAAGLWAFRVLGNGLWIVAGAAGGVAGVLSLFLSPDLGDRSHRSVGEKHLADASESG